MYNCVSTWKGDAKPVVDENGNIRVLEVSQFVPEKQIVGKVWKDFVLSYSVREKFVKPGYAPQIGSMYYTIDTNTRTFKFLIGTVDSSG